MTTVPASATAANRFSFVGETGEFEISPTQPLMRLRLDGETTAQPSLVLDPRESGEWTLHHEATGARITWSVRDGDDRVEVRVVLRREGRELLGELSLTHSGPRRVRQVQFPYVEWRPVHLYDRLLMASSWGDEIARPCQTIRAFCDAGGNRKRMGGDYVLTGDDEIAYTYPSILAMQHLVLHNPARSLYLACYGSDERTRSFNARVLSRNALALSVNHYPFVTNGDFATPTCALALLAGGWHAAADLYAERMHPRFTQAEVPAWMRESFHGWVEVMMKLEGRPPACLYRDLPKIYAEKVAPLGINVMHVAGWSAPSFDNLYPDYVHNPELGTESDLHAACTAIRALGGRVSLYTNLRLVDPRSTFFANGGSECVCVDEAGEPYLEGYGTSAKFRIACPSCTEYRRHVAAEMRRMVTAYGAGGAQTDQVACNLGYFCFDARHPHATPASNFASGLSDTLLDLRRAVRALDPDFFVWAEGCHERFGQHYDVHQGHGEDLTWQIGESIPEHFSFVFPGAIVTGHAKTDLQGLCHAHAQGKPFDVSVGNLEIPGYAELLAQFVALRCKYADFFLRGTFRDSVGLEVPTGMRAYRIDHREGGRAVVNLWRPGARPGDDIATELGVCFDARAVNAIYPADVTLGLDGRRIAVAWHGPIATLVLDR